jgi:hypothetical protein
LAVGVAGRIEEPTPVQAQMGQVPAHGANSDTALDRLSTTSTPRRPSPPFGRWPTSSGGRVRSWGVAPVPAVRCHAWWQDLADVSEDAAIEAKLPAQLIDLLQDSGTTLAHAGEGCRADRQWRRAYAPN